VRMQRVRGVGDEPRDRNDRADHVDEFDGRDM
jgi:hypothetical protein